MAEKKNKLDILLINESRLNMKFEFEPNKKIRSFKCSDFVGKIATIELGHLSDDKKKQYVTARHPDFKNYDIYGVTDWVNTLGKPKEQIKRKIKSVSLIEKCNGGRTDTSEYDSYLAYFNKEKKKEVLEYWKCGILGRINRCGGDPDHCCLKIYFDEFCLEENIWGFTAPEEWYSELHNVNGNFNFEKGFYKDADEAIKFFADKPHDDLFGERYFPVIVFPKNTKADVRMIANMPKSCSKVIVTDKYIIFGTRCKPHEYSEVIVETYKNGGFVAKAKEWNWE
jgi:hypothetical protein